MAISKDLVFSRQLSNMMGEGFIYIDKQGIIQIYNDRAKEIFGIRRNYSISHRGGKLSPGDLVIIANTSLGYDDGAMDLDSLRKLGLFGDEIDQGEAFLLVSKYMGENLGLAVGQLDHQQDLGLELEVEGLDLSLYLDHVKRLVNIRVDQVDYPLHYVEAIGNIVVLDGGTGQLKFYQTYGYTARKESINDILNGKTYREKALGQQDLDVVGKRIFDIHSSESLIEEFYRVALGQDLDIRNKYEEINGLPILSTIFPLDQEGERLGAALRIEDISQLETLIRQRDNIQKKLDISSKQLRQDLLIENMFKDFIASDKSLGQVKTQAYRASQNLSTVLLLGEKGVGKSLLARLIHKNSQLAAGDFLEFNSKSLDQAYLREKLDQTSCASLYFHDIDRLEPNLQQDLMKIIDSYPNKDLRLLASSSENLDQLLLEDRFNERLYYAININPIQLPALRDRKLDIRPLVDYQLARICEKMGIEEKRISPEAMEIIEDYSWPNNVRELINVLERAVSISRGSNILTKHIILMHNIGGPGLVRKTLKEHLESHEKNIIINSLALNKGDKKQTMKDLRVSQSSFYEKLNKYHIK